MVVILAILKFLGILLLVLAGIVLVVGALLLFVPVRYRVEFEEGEPVLVGFRVSWLMRAVQIRKFASEEHIDFYVFGMSIENLKRLLRREKKEYEDHQVTNSRVQLVDDFYDEAEKQEEKQKKEIKIDYEEEETNESATPHSGRGKKSFSFDKISGIIQFIKGYENKEGLRKIKGEFVALIRYLMPGHIEGKIVFGTGDPCTTGWILGAISMFQIAYTEGVTILPDFEEKVFQAHGYMKGKVRAIYFLRLLWRGYRDADMKGCIVKVMKMFGK